MPPKKSTPPPIDRPLSKAYLRQFTGWSTAFPPGTSEPTSLRVMENVWIDRNGAVAVRPGLKHLSYTACPDLDPLLETHFGTALGLQPVGSLELFYTDDGSKALLFAVREGTGRVGFRVLLFSGTDSVVHRLTDPEIGFTIPQGEELLSFDPGTTFVKYLQINNRVIALSDNGEPIRLFTVGAVKTAKRLKSISVPEWADDHKLSVIHPDAAWINNSVKQTRTNLVINPSFELGTGYWTLSARCSGVRTQMDTAGWKVLTLRSMPMRTNMVPSPLHDTRTTGTAGWYAQAGSQLSASGGYLEITATGRGSFSARSSKAFEGVRPDTRYRLAFDIAPVADMTPFAQVEFYAANGAVVGDSSRLPVAADGGRWESGAITTPEGTVSMRVLVGGSNLRSSANSIRIKDMVLCRDNEPTSMFHGGSGAEYFWVGTANQSASVHHPPTSISIRCRPVPVRVQTPLGMSIAVSSSTGSLSGSLRMVQYDKSGGVIASATTSANVAIDTAWSIGKVGTAATAATAVSASLELDIPNVARGVAIRVDSALIEPGVSTPGAYFDGSYKPTTTTVNSWTGVSNESPSSQTVWAAGAVAPVPETPAANSLIASGGAAANPYKMAFFYTFENEVGESAPSRITEVRMKRGWSQWLWQTPSAAGEPSGTSTATASLCADQLVCTIPRAVYEQAVAEGAVRWNLYGFSWSDQEPVPVVAQLIGQTEMYPDTNNATGLSYEQGGSRTVTPARAVSTVDTMLPTVSNRENYSDPPRHRNGIVAGDRVILVGGGDDAASIVWSSNQGGEYTNFTASRGGGRKTLTSGNLNLPHSIVLWQNPQSVDTLAVLCFGDDGRSTSYYMAPANVTTSSSGSASIMGFEETTSTPGCTSPWASEVLNNALYRPLDTSLLKSTANNYNIAHKVMTESISDIWWKLQSKSRMMSAQLDNRLYYIVHNPYGEPVQAGCNGNEIWVCDIGAETPHWSRFLIQAVALKVFSVGIRAYMGVVRPDGVYYLDPEAGLDDYVALDGTVLQRPIPWRLETNTQGANRAHDAWAHLQQAVVTVGSFEGTFEWGISGYDVHARGTTVSKRTTVPVTEDPDQQRHFSDPLLVRKDMKEWTFFARSVPGVESSGRLLMVQYRYTPTTVNVGYEHGSVETFEYGSPTPGYSLNGVPQPFADAGRSWM